MLKLKSLIVVSAAGQTFLRLPELGEQKGSAWIRVPLQLFIKHMNLKKSIVKSPLRFSGKRKILSQTLTINIKTNQLENQFLR